MRYREYTYCRDIPVVVLAVLLKVLKLLDEVAAIDPPDVWSLVIHLRPRNDECSRLKRCQKK